MKKLKFIIGQIWKGESVTRAYLNFYLSGVVLIGKTIDVGGGNNADYLSFMPKSEDCEFVTFDVKNGAQVDFETDPLPANNEAYDTVLFLNVMEHIYNYQHISNEVIRITKTGGQMIGFVPFLMWYHADHRDFFRYTHEALERILKTSKATNVRIEMVGGGPFLAAAQMILQSFPKILRVPIFLPFALIDKIYTMVKRENSRPYALGYLFIVKK